MIDGIVKDAGDRMDKAVMSTGHEFASVRTGRASAGLLEKLQVDYYGTKTPLNQLSTLTVPEPQLVVIQPWDKSALAEIEKAIMQSDLGLSPSNNGDSIRVPFPPLNEERRRDLVRIVKKQAEDGRIAVRNIRRDSNEQIKKQEKQHEISEDEGKRGHEEIQTLTNTHIQSIDQLLQAKEKEIMEV